MEIPSNRAPYSAIVDRPALPPLPGGKRMIVWTIINVEVWDISRPMPRTVLVPPQDKPLLPDVANWTWHEYGMRVGFWRFMSLFNRLNIRGTLAINGRVCVDYPRVAEAAASAGWEFMGHGYDQLPTHLEKDQLGMMRRTVKTITDFSGKAPIGWLAPGLSETLETPDNLAEAGIKYIADWVYDDEPTTITTARGPLVTIPYSLETNDIPVCVVQHHESAYWAQKCCDQFDQLYAESADRPKFMGIAIHPYVSGQPSRFKYLESIYRHIGQYADVGHWRGDEIFDWYVEAQARSGRL